MKILCICPIGLGNYLLTYPSYALLRTEIRDAELHLLALRHSIASLAHDDTLWKKIHVIDPTQTKGILSPARFIRDLSAERFDASLSFFPSNTWQYNLLPFLCGIRKRFAFNYPLKKAASLSFLNTNRLQVDPLAHDVNQNLRLVSSFSGRDVSAGPRTFPSLVTEKSVIDARRLLDQIGGPRVYVGVHPGSSSEHGMANKRWDPARFGELATRICKALDAQALVFGSADEEEIKQATASNVDAPHHVVAPTDLPTTAALLQRCAVMLSNDSGLMHLAACSGIPTAAIFGPTDERRSGPVGAGLVLRKPMNGFPLWGAANVGVRALGGGVDPQASLKALSVDDAWEGVNPWLANLKGEIRIPKIA